MAAVHLSNPINAGTAVPPLLVVIGVPGFVGVEGFAQASASAGSGVGLHVTRNVFTPPAAPPPVPPGSPVFGLLSVLRLDGYDFFTERNQETYAFQLGVYKLKTRSWSFSIVLQDDTERDRLITLFAGTIGSPRYQPVATILPDGTAFEGLLSPIAVPLKIYPFSVSVDIAEIMA